MFQYDAVPNLFSSSPLSGSTVGGTRVIIYGTGFKQSNDMECKFGVDVVYARWLTHESIVCVAPSCQPGRVALSVSLNGQDFTSSDLYYDYLLTATVVSVSPTMGSYLGGTQVAPVHGFDFKNSSKLACRFGSKLGDVKFVDSENILCVSPPSHFGSVNVALSSNGVDFDAEG